MHTKNRFSFLHAVDILVIHVISSGREKRQFNIALNDRAVCNELGSLRGLRRAVDVLLVVVLGGFSFGAETALQAAVRLFVECVLAVHFAVASVAAGDLAATAAAKQLAPSLAAAFRQRSVLSRAIRLRRFSRRILPRMCGHRSLEILFLLSYKFKMKTTTNFTVLFARSRLIIGVFRQSGSSSSNSRSSSSSVYDPVSSR